MYTFAQNFEDIILNRLFFGKVDGFYVDVGAHDPDFLSVTKSFYERGWRGVNIEPLKSKCDLFQRDRPRDININVAIGPLPGKIMLSRVDESSALSSTHPGRISELANLYNKIERELVDVVTLDSIFRKHIFQEVDFLKIDVEGAEADVLASIDLKVYRPKVLVIESVRPMHSFIGWDEYDPMSFDNSANWELQVISAGYVLSYFDGLNKFYLRDDCLTLKSRLSIPPGVFDFIVPSILERAGETMKAKESVIQGMITRLEEKDEIIRSNQRQMDSLQATVNAYHRAYGSWLPIGLLARLFRRSRSIFAPRLGNLNQYAPRGISALDAVPQMLPTYPRISIITPSYNQGEFIERTIRSVLNQQYPALEYFVQDGASKDSTTNVMKKYQNRLSGWVSEKDSGQSQAINRGMAKSSGEIMAWLNSDDMLLPGALNVVADYFNRHPDVDVVYGDRLMIDENDMEIGRWIMPGHDSDVLSWADYIPQETMFWRRRIWDKVGGKIDESFRFAMDWDLLIRFRDAGACFAHIPRFMGAFRIHQHQKTSASINEIGHQEMDRIRKSVHGRTPSQTEVRRSLLPYLIKHLVVDLGFRIKSRISRMRIS